MLLDVSSRCVSPPRPKSAHTEIFFVFFIIISPVLVRTPHMPGVAQDLPNGALGSLLLQAAPSSSGPVTTPEPTNPLGVFFGGVTRSHLDVPPRQSSLSRSIALSRARCGIHADVRMYADVTVIIL